jgi:leader peptidase (prepilin peptidase)/N-methyltransferase
MTLALAVAALPRTLALYYIDLRARRRTAGQLVRFTLPEVLTAVLVAGCFLRYGLSGEAFVAAFFVTALVVLSAIDMEQRLLPDRIVLPSAAVVFAAHLALAPERWLKLLLAPLGAALLLFATLLIHPQGMGMGDVKLCLLLGAALGKFVLVALVVGFTSALFPALLLVARHGSRGRKMGIPFGPFLALGAVVALFWGEALWNAYVGTL